jgi:Uma2 family endonuclease
VNAKETATSYPSKKRTYTYQDYLKLPDDRNRYEIINGELVMTPSPKTSHQRISGIIELQLRLFVGKNKLGEVFDSLYDVFLTNKDVVQPDILFVSNKNKKIIKEDNIKGAPDLIIEILSRKTAYYDLIEKRDLYEKFRVKEYWIVDPKKQWAEIYVQNKKHKLHLRVEKSGKVVSWLLKGFELELRQIFKTED